MEAPDGLLEVGHIRRTHGVAGDVIVELDTHRTDRLDPGARLYARDGWLTVERSRPYQNRWLVTFRELTNRETAQRYTNVPLLAAPLHDPDALWIHELIGSMVVETDGTPRGRCVGVVANPASDLLELESGALVPAVFVVDQSTGRDGRTVTIDPPAGLFEDFDADEDADEAPR